MGLLVGECPHGRGVKWDVLMLSFSKFYTKEQVLIDKGKTAWSPPESGKKIWWAKFIFFFKMTSKFHDQVRVRRGVTCMLSARLSLAENEM